MTSMRKREDAILDAARQCIEAFGVRRTTLTDVARRAGVSRPTVYRHWPDISSLVGDLLTRELRAVFDASALHAPDTGARERLIHQCAGTVAALWAHPLFNRLVDTETDVLATYVFHRLGSSQRAALELIHAEIEAGHADGSIRDGDPAELSRIVLLTVQSVTTSRRLVEDALSDDRLLDGLRRLLAGYLQPLEATR
ncbi:MULTISPECIES: TetR/AcrR family transcriptional regulator [unclassified Streptomyces]|uniref:TetR/AcrR family transcriptional regulator n=1 Tax=unclassified Streptomyces TaxID=2593676 RepID=UPI003FD0F4E9